MLLSSVPKAHGLCAGSGDAEESSEKGAWPAAVL